MTAAIAIPLAASIGAPPPTATSAIRAARAGLTGAEETEVAMGKPAPAWAASGAEALSMAVTAAAEAEADADAAALAADSATAPAPAAMSSVLGTGCTPENRRAGRQASASTARTVAITGVAAVAASVTTTTWSAPAARTSAGSWATAPIPKCAAGFAAIINPSTDICGSCKGVLNHRGSLHLLWRV